MDKRLQLESLSCHLQLQPHRSLRVFKNREMIPFLPELIVKGKCKTHE